MTQTSARDTVGNDTLYAVIGAVAEGPDLDRVLRAVVDLLVDATSCHACFVYLREGDVLRVRAASPVFEHVVDRVAFRIDEGLTGWVARNRTPAFIREDAMNDPRMKYVPELREEHFQSMVAVPLVDRRGDVIGVVVLHTEAPREFGQDVLEFLVHVASLVVGAIDNARLYEETQEQVAALSALSALSQQLASLTRRDALYAAGCSGLARLLRADRCRLALFDPHGAAVEVAVFPADDEDDDESLLHAPAGGRLTARLLEGGRAFGQVRVARETPFDEGDARLLETATNQLALALRTAGVIERLAAENRIRQVFDALEQGDAEAAFVHAKAAGWETGARHVAIVATPTQAVADRWEERTGPELVRRLHLVAGDVLADLDRTRLRGLIAVFASGTADPAVRLAEELAAAGSRLGVNLGISDPRDAPADDASILGEAEDAAIIAAALEPNGGARTYTELGPYRFLVGLVEARRPDARHAQALSRLAEYDERRGSALLDTLEAYLAARGAVRATAEALIVHPNTLRQRLERIEKVSGLALDDEDLLSLELSIKLHRLSI
jgi:hypothetical protein